MTRSFELQPSPRESARFGRSVARLTVADDATDEAAEAVAAACRRSPADLLVVRYPARLVRLFATLAAIPDRRALHADTLMWWRWDHAGGPVGGPELRHARPEEVAPLVRDVFADYRNHYAANPDLDRAAALEGYVEWAGSLAGGAGGWCLVLDDDDVPSGFAVVSLPGGCPDVALAGIVRAARGRGAYGRLVEGVMRAVVAAGHPSVTISTQAHNVPVMATWSRLGWRPTSAVETVHLTRPT